MFVLVAALISQSAGQRTQEPPWKHLQEQLTHEGFKADTASLIGLARSEGNDSTRWMAIEILGLRGEQEARGALHEIVKDDPSSFIRESAAVALARLGDSAGVSLLRQMVKTASIEERQLYLASQLALLNDSSGYSYVVTATQSKDAHVRYLSARALGAFVQFEVKGSAGIDAIEQLILLANDADPKVRDEIITQFALAVYQGASIAKFRPIVENMARNDADQEVKDNAAQMLILWKEQCRTGCK